MSGLSGEAIEQVGKSVGKSGGLAAQTSTMKAMAEGSAAGSKFGRRARTRLEMMEHVQGRIPETAREMVQSGKVRPMTEAALISTTAAERGCQYWKDFAGAERLLRLEADIIFIRNEHSTEDIVGTLIHEATHGRRGQQGASGRLHVGGRGRVRERDFYMTLYAAGGPLHGTAPESERIQSSSNGATSS